MKIINDGDNLVYDSDNPLCSIEINNSQGELFAFITALDIGVEHRRLKEPQPMKYWGKFSWNDEAGSIKEILHTGGKWPRLQN